MFSKKVVLNTLCEFGPILGFIVAYELKDFMTGVIVMMIATVVSLVILRRVEKHTPIFALISSGSVLFFGGTSLFIDIPSIFILRDTVFDLVFGIAILISVWNGKPLFKYIFSGVFAITDRGWRLLSLRWGIFFIILALLNEWVRLTLTPDDWVIAKICIIVASVVFGTYQLTLTKHERLPTATAWGIVQ
jgi:intracellular septation protein